MQEPRICIRDLNVRYGQRQALRSISADIPARGITAIIGPSGCGKSTLLKSLNRLLEENESAHISGQVIVDGVDIYGPGVDVIDVRTRVGLLAPKPFPLPMSIYENVAYGLRIHSRVRRRNGRRSLDEVVERYLRTAGLWDEVCDRLKTPASGLSTGQQQRLCLARTLAVEPEVLLCDEPTSALDPLSAQRIEAQLQALKEQITVVIVTHLLRQARRMADHVIFMWLGELAEAGPADEIFRNPKDPRTQAFLRGEIG